MDTPIIQPVIANERILKMIRQTCLDIVDETPEAKELLAQHNAFLAEARAKVSREQYGIMEDLFFRVAAYYGDTMFDMGIALGRNPAAIFDLPNTENPFGF
jgi:hypothetical protein